MSTVPPGTNPPTSMSGFSTPDYAAMQAHLIQQQVDSEIRRLNNEYEEYLHRRVDEISREALVRIKNAEHVMRKEIDDTRAYLESEARRRLRNIGVGVLAAVVGAFIVAVLAQSKAVNQSVIDFQNSVLGLQKEVMASQTTITTATRELGTQASLLATANKDVEAATRRLEATTAEYAQRLEALKGATGATPVQTPKR